jgi:hypothetical protein
MWDETFKLGQTQAKPHKIEEDFANFIWGEQAHMGSVGH